MNSRLWLCRFSDQINGYLCVLADEEKIYRITISAKALDGAVSQHGLSKKVADEIRSIEQGMLGAAVVYKYQRYQLEGTEKTVKIFNALLAVPRGKVITYGELARRAGIINGGRFAGTVMAKNMLPIVFPCHRVIPSDGTIGNYGYGSALKRQLLEAEGVRVSESGKIDERFILRK